MNSNPVWHPYSQMKTAPAPVSIRSGKGAWLETQDGKQILDLISSWWVTIHGHAHPYIADKIGAQARQLEQVIFAGFTHAPAQEFAAKLISVMPEKLTRIFYSDNGSTAVEVALKMALQYWDNLGKPRRKILAFRSAYHGDTFGAMSVSARSVFTRPFFHQLFEVVFLPDPDEGKLAESLRLIEQAGQESAAFIYEPLVMGAAGMRVYEADTLDALMNACRQQGMLLIADEVMTGFGRTGTLFASEQCRNKPDLLCLSKGITGGFLPMGATAATDSIYEAFWDDDRMKTFFHGHSYTANPLACTAALASLECFEREETLAKIAQIEAWHQAFLDTLLPNTMLSRSVVKGSILALTLQDGREAGADYLSNLGPVIYHWFLERGFLMRPLGNVLYLLPPYCIQEHELESAYAAIQDFLRQLQSGNMQKGMAGPVFG